MANESYALNIIKEFYGDSKAVRSKVPKIMHIYEGIGIIDAIYGERNQVVVDAFALHPLIQEDRELAAFYNTMKESPIDLFNPLSLILAVEYRNIANNYLSPYSNNPYQGSITLSPLTEVNVMLIADKVQNRKDFELYHKDSHENSESLSEYFKEWLSTLGVSEPMYYTLATIGTNYAKEAI